MSFFYLKALHIIFVVTWFAGLFYIVRLFIYHREAMDKDEPEKSILIDQFSIMQKRLWYGITWPSAILTLIFGPSLLPSFMPLKGEYWLHAKLLLVFFLFLYHLQCGRIFKSLQRGETHWTSMKLRLWNELATLFLVAIVFLVILKDMASMGWAILGLIVFAGVLMLGIRFYRKLRSS
jgi:putative membrane protein